METFVPAAAMVTLIGKFVDFLKSVTNKDVNGVVTQLTAWAAGVAGVWLYAQTQWADQISFGDRALAQMNGASLIAVGLGASSLMSVLVDFKKARDQSDSARTPPLIPAKVEPVTQLVPLASIPVAVPVVTQVDTSLQGGGGGQGYH